MNEFEELDAKLKDYKFGSDSLCRIEKRNNNSEERINLITLANGSIVAVKQIKRDDGATVESVISLKVYYNNGTVFTVEVPEKDLDNKLFSYLPVGYRPEIKGNAKAYIVDSIRAQEPFMEKETIYEHTGWRVINEKPVFLFANKAVGDDSVKVELWGRLAKYCVSENTDNERWDVLKKFLEVAPHRVTYPLLAIAALSPLNEFLRQCGYEPSFLLFLLGKSNAKKSTLAALTLCFFGNFDNKSLPGSFKDTENSLEKIGFILKDILTVIDDFHPSSSIYMAKLNQTAQAVCRMYGDRTGKNRMNADGSLRVNYPVRGNAIITGEDVPAVGLSGQARFVAVEILPDDVNLDILSEVQAKSECLSECMREYILWLAEQFSELPKTLCDRFLKIRTSAQNGGHGRIAEAIAHLQLSMELWSVFLSVKNIINAEEAEAIKAESWSILKELAEKQNESLTEEKPTYLFLSALRELITTKKVYIQTLGEEKDTIYCGSIGSPPIGWVDKDYFYLLFKSAYNAVCKFYRESDRNFPIGEKGLLKYLKTENLVGSDDKGNVSRQKKIKGKNQRVVYLFRDAIEEKEEDSDV